MKILIAPDKFKDSLPAPAVAAAIAEGVRRVFPSATLDLCPLADGGEGTVDALLSATGGHLHHATVTGPLPGTHVSAPFALLPTGDAVLEMAAASGLSLLPPKDRNPLHTTTYGTGELIRAALAAGAQRILLGIGGSATTDGGLGCAQACGSRIWIDTSPHSRSRFNTEESLPTELHSPFTGADLSIFHSLTPPTIQPDILVACDVTNPLFGPTGAAHVFSPQKGATPEAVHQLDAGLQRLATRTRRLDLASTPGSGAAGGLGFGLLAFLNAKLLPGIDLVLDAVRFRDRLQGASLCITAEGRLDSQSLSGKTPIGVLRACQAAGVPCIALAGQLDLSDAESAGFTLARAIAAPTVSIEERIKHAATFLASAAEQVAREI